jgi:tripartite ATP-independent transporter DctM subunit
MNAELIDWLELQAARIARKLASIGVLLMLAIALLTVIDVLLRWLASASVPGFNEIIQLSMAVAIASTFPAGVTSRINLTIDIFERKVSAQTRSIFVVIGSLVLLLLFVLLTYRMGVHAMHLHDRNAISLFLEIPEAPFFFVVTFLFAAATLAQAIVYLKDLKTVVLDSKKLDPSLPLGAKFFVIAFGLTAAIAVVVFSLGLVAESFVPTALDHSGAYVGVLFVLLWVMALGFIPIAAATGLTGLLGTAIFLGNGPALSVLGSEAAEYLSNPNLAVLPLFLMMGGFAAQAGLASDIYRLAHSLFAKYRGGLAMATIGGCAGFGALTGSSIAAAATIGQVALPEMRKRGYSPGLAAGCVAAGGTLGQLVPPSTAIILYAVLTEQSIGQLFVAAVIPAILAVVVYLLAIKAVVGISPAAAPAGEDHVSFKEIVDAAKGSLSVLALFLVVIGGLYGGVFTATESAAVGAGAAFLFALFRGKLKGEALWDVMAKTTAMTAMIFLLIIGAVNFSFFIAISGLPEIVTAFVQGLDVAPLVIVTMFLVLYILMGSVMDPFPIMIITVPIVAPVIGDLGYSLIWWGIIMVSVVETGMITPPFGINVFVLKNIAGGDVPLPTIFRGVLPFVLADLIKLALLVLFPILVLWLPSTM